MWKEQLLSLCYVRSSDRSGCVSLLGGVTVPASCWCPQRSCWEKPGCSFQKQQALHCRWVWLLLVQLCVMSVQQSNLGWTGHSPHGILLNCSLLIVGRTESGSLAAAPASSAPGADQLLANPLVQPEEVGWAFPEWERGVHSPWGCSALSQHRGDGWTERCICTLHWPQPAARLLLHAGQELHCQHVSMGKVFISFSSLVFPFS